VLSFDKKHRYGFNSQLLKAKLFVTADQIAAPAIQSGQPSLPAALNTQLVSAWQGRSRAAGGVATLDRPRQA
jgi:hypothetical protein